MVTTLQNPDGSKQQTIETVKLMIEQLIPEDNAQDDTDHRIVGYGGLNCAGRQQSFIVL
jgi:hypothetical protein